MNTKKVRNLAFSLHRYLGLVTGLIAVIIGLTGSILVFHSEIDHFLVTQKVGLITPQSQLVSLTSIIDKVEEAYSIPLSPKIHSLDFSRKPNEPYQVWLESSKGKWTEVFVNPYTGAILGDRIWEKSLFGVIYQLHYQLLGGKVGLVIAGIVAFVLFILSLTGIILWPGWRKLISGFKIKWNAHPKRVNFDVHKVTGIVVAMFLGAIALTGFCWNFYDQTKPLIYAATLTPKPPEPISQPIPGKSPLSIEKLVSQADIALPGAETVTLLFPQTPTDALRVRKRFPEELTEYGNSGVYLDQYTGKVLQIENALQPSRAQAILNAFGPIHFGTFGGLPMRIFYVFVGLTPAILFVTGLVMWRYRKRPSKKQSPSVTSIY